MLKYVIRSIFRDAALLDTFVFSTTRAIFLQEPRLILGIVFLDREEELMSDDLMKGLSNCFFLRVNVDIVEMPEITVGVDCWRRNPH